MSGRQWVLRSAQRLEESAKFWEIELHPGLLRDR
jgi:hypothetical protein